MIQRFKPGLLAVLRRLGLRAQPAPTPAYQRGRGTYGHPTVLDWGEGAKLSIGAFCSIANGVTILLGGEHRTDWVTTYPFSELWPGARHIKGHPKTKGDIVIGNDVWIGRNATLLSGITVGDGAVIGSEAVVGKNVAPYTIVAGNPAVCVRQRFSAEIVAQLAAIAWWDWADAEIEAAIPFLLSRDIQAFIDYAQTRRESA